MFPAQTSLIPVQVALARFLEQDGNIFSNYPYWYLGTTPFRYLSGPILPIFASGLHRIFPFLSLFEIFFLLIGVMWVIGGIGVYWLVREMVEREKEGEKGDRRRKRGRETGVLAAIFYAFGPIVPFLFRFSDGLYLITFSFLPFTLLVYLRLLRRWTRKLTISCVVAIAFLILLDSLIIPTLIFGMGAIFLAQVGWKKTEEKLKQTFSVLSFSFLVATLWYTPGYWLTLLGAPSLAGVGVIRVIGWLGKLLPTALAFGIAIFSVKFFKKRNLLRDFCFYWLFIFGFLTLLRFLSDPDFWLDWTSYNVELQMSLAILGGLGVGRLVGHANRTRMRIVRIYANVQIGILVGVMGVAWLFIVNRYVIGTLQRDIAQTVEYKIGSQLLEIAKPGEHVFLSGTTAFWLNAFFDIPQVRGGVDQASVDPNWRKAVWEIREGATAKAAKEWLRTLNVSYLVVHTKDSAEFYHDFTYPEKFERAPGLKKIYDEGGNRIYWVLD